MKWGTLAAKLSPRLLLERPVGPATVGDDLASADACEIFVTIVWTAVGEGGTAHDKNALFRLFPTAGRDKLQRFTLCQVAVLSWH